MALTARPAPASSNGFAGFPVAALDFYDDLEVDNTKSFWQANKQVYLDAVRRPMTELTDALADEFGRAKLFRPNRDVRFAADKAPYKTHQGAYVAVGPATGWYVQISAAGVRTGAGWYDATPPRLGAIRQAIDDERTGPALARLLDGLTRSGFERGGDTVKTAPRGWSADHPRIELLRHKSLTLGRSLGFEPVIHTPHLLEQVRADWRALRPLVQWIAAVRLEEPA